MSRKETKLEEEPGLRRSTRQRYKQGEVVEGWFKETWDGKLCRDQREDWSTEPAIGEEDRLEIIREMSRKDNDGKDPGRGGSEQPGLTELFQLMMADNRRRDDEARRREEQERIRRDDEQRRREEDYRLREQRWAEQLQAQRESTARPTPRFPPHFDKGSLLKLTGDCKDLEGYMTVFEAQLAMEEVPIEEWKALLIGQLDATHRLRVAELVADANSTYADIVSALRVSGGDTGLSAAQRYFRTEPDLSRFQDVQKGLSVLSQWSAKIAEGAQTVKEALGAMDRARMRAYLNPQLREFLDGKDVSSSAQMVARVEEWRANTFDRVNVFGNPGGRRVNSAEVGKSVRKPGECFLCGKPGHFAKECSSTGKTVVGNASSTPGKGIAEQTNKTFKCYGCGETGHKRPDCPNKMKRNKKVRVTKCKDLGHNDVMARVGDVCLPVTLDTGADITLLPEELKCVKEYTGRTGQLL